MPDNSKSPRYFLYILPIFYGVICCVFYSQLQYFYATLTEPSYAYLVNSLNMAMGHFDSGMVEHPGSTVEWLGAVVLFFTHKLRGNGNLLEDVLSRPEMYLGACAFVLVILLMFSVYKSGTLVYNHTGNMVQSLFFQLLPIISYTAVHHFIQLRPESMLIILINYYCAYIWVLFYDRVNEPDGDFSKKEHLLFFSLFTALLITTKISTVPFIIIPFLFFKKLFPKIKYIVFTVLFAAVIIFPIWSKLPIMYQWIHNLITHSGIYGQGREEVVDANVFKSNLSAIINIEYFFTIGYFLTTIALIANIFKNKKDRTAFFNLGFMLWLVITVQIVLVAKHYSYYYLIPAQMLTIPAFISLNSIKTRKAVSAFILVLCAGWLCFKTTQNGTVYKNGNGISETIKYKEKYAGLPKIITTHYQNTCYAESILKEGIGYSGTPAYLYYYYLRKKYPDTYFCCPKEYSLLNWDLNCELYEIAKKSPSVVIYFHDWDYPNIETELFDKIKQGNETLIKSIKLDYENPGTKEKFYILTFNADARKDLYKQSFDITCDIEQIINGEFVSSNDSIRFKGADVDNVTSEKFVSGKCAIKLTGSRQYGCSRSFFVHPGDMFEIDILGNSQDRQCNMILDARSGNFYGSSESIVDELANGWKRIKLKTIIPDDFKGNEVTFYLFYPGSKTCYVDDLHIKYYNKQN
jgi:hypothetical protein